MTNPRYKKFEQTPWVSTMSRLLGLAGDETRLRIFCFMFEYKEACVSDIAESLGMTVASISHHLQMMKDNGLFTTERMGTMICYRLVENQFTKDLKKLICH